MSHEEEHGSGEYGTSLNALLLIGSIRLFGAIMLFVRRSPAG
jgi:hypothetical protein